MSNTVHFQARGRTVVGCTLLVIALGASVTACLGDDDNPLLRVSRGVHLAVKRWSDVR